MFLVILYSFPTFGILYQEKSGIPDLWAFPAEMMTTFAKENDGRPGKFRMQIADSGGADVCI
jgi:hypothetical protein